MDGHFTELGQVACDPRTARVNPKTRARPGRTIDLAVDAASLHYFDPDTGQAISRGRVPAGQLN